MVKKSKRWLSLLLAASTLCLNASSVYAEPVQLTAEEAVISESEVEVAEEVTKEPAQELENEETDISEAAEKETEASEPATVVEPVASPEDTEDKTEVKAVDHGDGTVDLELANYTIPSNLWEIRFAVWSEKNDQDDLKWYIAKDLKTTLDLKNHNDELGNYNIHVYEALKDGSMNCVATYVLNVASITRPDPQVTAVDQNGTEKVFTIKLENFTAESDTDYVTAAIWSDKDDQDDLKWYTLKVNDTGDYSYSFKPAAHKTAGSYKVHIYERKKNGKMNFLCETTLSVSEAVSTGIEVKNLDEEKGTADVFVKDVTCPSGISRVVVPIWSKADQSDIVWYEGEAQDDGSYKVTLDISKHKYNIGVYQIHAYATNGNGVQTRVGTTTAEFKNTDAIVSVTKKDESYLLKTGKIKVSSGVKEIQYAVWSEENDQDDLKWFTGKYNETNASASYTLTLKGFTSTGVYNVHCYAKDTNGKMVFLGKTTFNVEKATLKETIIETDAVKGSFTIKVTGLESGSGVTKVQIPVWSKKDQSDIVWYDAVKDSDGNYVVSSTIAKHKYNFGTYNAHVYVTENSGVRSCMDEKTFTMEVKAGTVSVIEKTKNTTYTAMISSLTVPAGAKAVEFAVWSEKDNQDDLKWYTASATSSGAYTASISVKNHKTTGLYYAHAYYTTQAGKKVFIGSAEFTVTTSAISTGITAGSPDSVAGSFKVTVSIPAGSESVSKVQIPVWSKSDQSDIYWYTATKQDDGTYTATVKVSNHNNNLGTFNIHVYTTFANGIRLAAGTSTYTFNPENFIAVTKTKDRYRKLTLKNCSSSVTKVTFAVWSDDKGQDDLVWYTATKQSDGTWTATVNSKNHKSSGNYQVHCYQNGAFVCNTTFTFAKSEMVKNGWYYENGYKFYYKDGTKQTNLTSIIGAQSSYVAKVNRTTCTITIYANDPESSKGYIIPVIAFTCSVGLPDTPTTAGTHYTFAKYRWKELMGPSWGQYATKFTSDGIYFHSVAGSNTTSYNLSYIDYNNLGVPASHGCVRLCVRDAKWIYDNCPLGMKVIVYDSSDPGPYGKPATIKIPAGQTWDPTDPNI